MKRFEPASAGEPAARVARRSVGMRLLAVEHFAPLAALLAKEDVEHVHQLRVATRRAEAALALYREFLPRKRTKKLKRMLKKLRKASGEARDLDVLLERLAAETRQRGARPVIRELKRRRQKAQRPLRELHARLFGGARFRRRADEALRRMGPSRRVHSPHLFGEWAQARLRRQLSCFLAAGERNLDQPAVLHQFRIRGKRLRYAVELLGGAFPAEARKAFHRRLSDIQDRLGDVNDRRAAIDRLNQLRSVAADDREAQYLDDRLAAEREKVEALHRDFCTWWRDGQREAMACEGEEFASSLNDAVQASEAS